MIHFVQVIFQGKGTAGFIQLLGAPLEPDNGTILVQQVVILFPGDAAAAGGNDSAGQLAQAGKNLRLQSPEVALAVPGEDGGDVHARLLLDEGVGLVHRAAQLFAQGGGQGAFAAGGHTHQDNVLHLAGEHLLNAANLAVRDAAAGEQLAAAPGLGHQHIQAAGTGDAQLLRLQKQGGAGRIVHHIQHSLALGELRQIHRRLAVVGVHAHGGGVGDDPGVGVLIQIVVIVLAAPGDDSDACCPQHFQHRHHRDGGAAAAQHQGLFALNLDAAFFHQAFKAIGVGIVAIEAAVRAADNGVHAADAPGGVRQFGAVGKDSLFVGDGHIDAVPIAVFQKILQLLRLPLKELIIITGKHAVNGRGIAVSQLLSKQTAF